MYFRNRWLGDSFKQGITEWNIRMVGDHSLSSRARSRFIFAW